MLYYPPFGENGEERQMSWIGAGIGAFLGAQRGGVLGGVIGAVLGNWVEGKARKMMGAPEQARRPGDGASSSGGASGGEITTLGALSAMLAKLAKADGRITEDEVRYCEKVFDRIGLHGEKREYCIRVFRAAKGDSHTIYDYAASFAATQPSGDIREIVYGVLWDLACADGDVSQVELEILRRIVDPLRLSGSIFAWECERRGVQGTRADGHAAPPDPYEVLGCPRNASDEDVKRAYRDKAKQLHPDALRAQGLSDELIAKANDQMARVNAAWSAIRQERRI